MSNGSIPRRDFLKGVSALGGAAAALGLGGSVPAASEQVSRGGPPPYIVYNPVGRPRETRGC